MILIANDSAIKRSTKKFVLPTLFRNHRKKLHRAKLFKLAQRQQNEIEQQIKMLSLKLPIKKSIKINYNAEQKVLLLEKIKILAVKLSLNMAEQNALSGQDIEIVLQPVITQLIEQQASFPIDRKWLVKRIASIRNLALDT